MANLGIKQAPAKAPHIERIGTSGTDIIAGFICEEHLPELSTPYERAIVYDRMRRSDSTIATLLRGLELPLKRATYNVEAPESPDDQEAEATEFLKYVLFTRMHKPWVHFLNEALRIFQYGNTAFEEVHAVEDWEYSPHAKEGETDAPPPEIRSGMVVWEQFGFLHPKTIRRWFISPQDRVIGIEQWGYYQDGAKTWYEPAVVIDGDFLLLFALDQIGNNFEGTALIRAAYRDYKALESLQKIQLHGCERMAVGVPIIEEPQGVTDEERNAARAIVRGYGKGEEPGMVMPPGWKATVQDGKMNENCLREALDFHKGQILMLGLMQFLTHGMGKGSSGNRAMAGSQIDLFVQLLQATGDYMAEAITRKAQGLLKLNYSGLKRFPKVKLAQILEKDIKGAIDSINACLQAGSVPPYDALSDYVVKLLDAPPRPKDIPITTTLPKDPGSEQQAVKDENQSTGLTGSGHQHPVRLSETAGKSTSAADRLAKARPAMDRLKRKQDAQQKAIANAATALSQRQLDAIVPQLERAVESGDIKQLDQVRLPLQNEFRSLLTDHLAQVAEMGHGFVSEQLGKQSQPADRTAIQEWAHLRAGLMADSHENGFRNAVLGELANQMAGQTLRSDAVANLSEAFVERAGLDAAGRVMNEAFDVLGV